MRIGVYSDSYPDKRMILNKIPDCQYVQIENKRENIARVLRLLGRAAHPLTQSDLYAREVHFTLDTSKNRDIDIIHTFNRVCLHDRNPWVATFEKTFPEYFSDETKLNIKQLRKQLPLLLSDNCRAILPMSQWAYNYECWLLSQIANRERANKIREKMMVLYPPQQLLTTEEEIHRKYEDIEIIRFLYVGTQMKRKGGIEALRAFHKLSSTYHNFVVTVIGKPDAFYNNFSLSAEEMEEVNKIISGAHWLEYYSGLKNEAVIEKARKAHVGLLPTLGDTFGFSVLEMQACGCPVITTDRQALPEINNNESGWILNTGKVHLEHGDDFAHYSHKEVHELSSVVESQLTEKLVMMLEDAHSIETKAISAFRRVARIHDPEQYARELALIYRAGVDE